MVYHALSKAAKKHQSRQEEDQMMAAAVEACRSEIEKPSKPHKSIRQVARDFKVDRKTLGRRLEGEQSMSTFNAGKQKLTPAEESVVVDFVMESADRGFPLTHRNIELQANTILRSRSGDEAEPVGPSWIDRFLTRHREQLQPHWSRPLDTQRAQNLNQTTVPNWFDLVEEYIYKSGGEREPIRPENIYKMDETGMTAGDRGTHRVIGRRGTKVQHKQGSADRETVTAIATICADGTALRPTLIFKGKNFMAKWGENNIANAS
jgi:hypothetical protein